jgi:hypothetical protein
LSKKARGFIILNNMNWLIFLLSFGVILIVAYLILKKMGVDIIDSIMDSFDDFYD